MSAIESPHLRPITAGIIPVSQYGQLDLHVELGGEGSEASFWGMFQHPAVFPRQMDFLSLSVHPDIRRHGVATRLIGALACVAIENGTESMVGSVESQHTLRGFIKVFGADALSLLSGRSLLPPTATAEEAWDWLQQAEALETDLENRRYGISVKVDLRAVDMARLERPISIPIITDADMVEG